MDDWLKPKDLRRMAFAMVYEVISFEMATFHDFKHDRQ
jgi:hypothetical protein